MPTTLPTPNEGPPASHRRSLREAIAFVWGTLPLLARLTWARCRRRLRRLWRSRSRRED
jgi:hypothetical protein